VGFGWLNLRAWQGHDPASFTFIGGSN